MDLDSGNLFPAGQLRHSAQLLHHGKLLHHGQYLLGDAFGRGDRVATYRAVCIERNQPVVIKSLDPEAVPADFAPLKQQFLADARQFSRCQHPGLVKILDIFEEAGLPYVVMDFVPGQNLADWIQTHGPLPEPQALQYVRQVASAVHVLHQQGWVHLDIRPQNMVRPPAADFVVLTDFGFAQAAIVRAQLATTSQPLVDYIALEQYRAAEPVTAATDVYALAASLYHLVTGQPPLAAPLRHRSTLVTPRQIQPQLSPLMETAILRGLEMNALARPQTLADWLTLLRPPTPGPSGTRHQSTREPPQLPQLKAPASPVSPAEPVPLALQSGPTKTVPGQALPGKAVPGQAVPGKAVPGKAVPGQAVPGQAVRAKAAPGNPAVISPQPGPGPAMVASNAVNAAIAPRLLPSRQTLMKITTIAAGIGLAGGLVLRLIGGTGPGSEFFHPEQAFPAIPNWQGAAEPTAPPAAPPLPPEPLNRARREPAAQPSPPARSPGSNAANPSKRSAAGQAAGNGPAADVPGDPGDRPDPNPAKPVPSRVAPPAASPPPAAPRSQDPTPDLPPPQDAIPTPVPKEWTPVLPKVPQ